MSFVPAKAPSGAMTLAAKWYISPDIFAQEQDRIFAREWICVGRAGQIQDPGDFFLTEIGGESLIVTRDERGDIRAFYNVCRHRGTRLCTEESGSFGRSIQCPYHAWTYGLGGELRAARNMDKETGFDRADYPLHGAAIDVFEGFIFIHTGDARKPFEASFAPIAGRFAPWEIGTLRSGHRTTYDLDCNWKLVFLNYSECYHCPLIHPQLEKLSP
nr:aromatic ring-hydroxylating dioxygenase subunit alpha [Candidatus Eremiobacteraeota bacterium]